MSSYKLQRYFVDENKYDRMLMTNDIEGLSQNNNFIKKLKKGAKPRKFIREINIDSKKISRASEKAHFEPILQQYEHLKVYLIGF